MKYTNFFWPDCGNESDVRRQPHFCGRN